MEWTVERMHCHYITGVIKEDQLEFAFYEDPATTQDGNSPETVHISIYKLRGWTPRMVMVLMCERIRDFRCLSLTSGFAKLDISNIIDI